MSSVNRSYYDVGRNLGAKPWYLVSRIAIPSALPHTFVGLFMGLYYSFAVLAVAEILGAKYGRLAGTSNSRPTTRATPTSTRPS